MARRGTLLFPDLGAQCDEAECNQLDFLPFECDGCGGTFCAAHRTYRDHRCGSAKAVDQGRTVVVCPDCGDSIERAGQADRYILDAHARSGRCDPARKRKPRCSVPRCKEALTFCNATQCKGCGLKTCLKNRFPSEHECAARRRGATGAKCGGLGARKMAAGGGHRPLGVAVRSFKIPAAIGRALRVIWKK
ncbi:hypothetical protein HU200_042059 [Digitaria exilis]|uniref:AN1-type domain-containing protein n=1 Tax=Digitaria exilis TaxID=1010633 RepID=A0A835EF56_9POAL|nr:hypothetical protein HU200_042059 [Digitaria exilis]